MRDKLKRFWKKLVSFMVEAGEGIWEATKNGNYPYL